MRLVLASGVLLACLLAFACSTGQTDEDIAILSAQTEDDGGSKPLPKTSASDAQAEDSSPDKTTKDAAAPATDEDECSDPDGCEPPVTPPSTGPVTANCTSQTSGHTSVSHLTYTQANGKITISSLTTVVTNYYDNDLNDLSVYVKTTTASTYVDIVDSGDILASGKTVSIPLPANLKLSPGDTIRIDTSFDEAFVPDPRASCVVQL